MTLIEVAIGIGLLTGLLLLVMETTKGISKRFLQMEQKIEAIEQLDRFLLELDYGTLALAGRTSGVFPDCPHMGWNFEPMPGTEDPILGVYKVRLQVFAVAKANAPLTSVELVVPLPETSSKTPLK